MEDELLGDEYFVGEEDEVGEDEEMGWVFPSAPAAQSTALATMTPKTTAKEWLQKPTWSGGPPRWQTGLAGVALTFGLAMLGVSLGKRR